MARIPLEDNVGDILAKAQRGLELAESELTQRAAVTTTQFRAAKTGATDESVLRKLADVLHLSADALIASAHNSWYPNDPGPIDGLTSLNTPFGDMAVNAFITFDPATRQAILFDTSVDADAVFQILRDHKLHLKLILLTHTHTDHVCELDRLKQATSAKAFVSAREPLPGAEPFPDGKSFTLDSLKIETRRTSGHARGGVTFIVSGLAKTLAIVGDAIFAGSMGGGLIDYQEALRTNRDSIFTLPDDTVLCPGHGPLTTVAEEKLHNPFFPEFQQQQSAQQQQQ